MAKSWRRLLRCSNDFCKVSAASLLAVDIGEHKLGTDCTLSVPDARERNHYIHYWLFSYTPVFKMYFILRAKGIYSFPHSLHHIFANHLVPTVCAHSSEFCGIKIISHTHPSSMKLTMPRLLKRDITDSCLPTSVLTKEFMKNFQANTNHFFAFCHHG